MVRWIWGKESGIQKEEHITVINAIKKCTWAQTPNEFEMLFRDLIHNEASPAHPRVNEKPHQACDRKQEWAIAFRQNMLTCGNHTNTTMLNLELWSLKTNAQSL